MLLVEDVAELFSRRHGIAHGLWERTDDGAIVAYRATRWSKHNDGMGEDRIERVGGTAEQLRELADQLDAALTDVMDEFLRFWPPPWGSPPPAVHQSRQTLAVTESVSANDTD